MVTSADGVFTINVSEGKGILVFSFVGYKNKRLILMEGKQLMSHSLKTITFWKMLLLWHMDNRKRKVWLVLLLPLIQKN
ncbi:hypothetical protein [Pedobacter steynii]